MLARPSVVRGAIACALVALVACGDGPTFVGEDPPSGGEGGFDPGPAPNGPSSGAYGYGYGAADAGTTITSATTTASGSGGSGSGTGGSGGEPPPECADELKRCAHVFTYDNADASSVEVRGDFEPGAWEAGVSMEKAGSTWTAEVPVPWDTDVQYRFFLNGAEWVTDPANPDQIEDGFGGFNSLLEGATCPDDFTCAR